jgi:hypothetical protein
MVEGCGHVVDGCGGGQRRPRGGAFVLGGPGPLDIMSLPKSVKLGYAVFLDRVQTPELLRKNAGRLFGWIRQRESR